jgi:hypothetical protein
MSFFPDNAAPDPTIPPPSKNRAPDEYEPPMSFRVCCNQAGASPLLPRKVILITNPKIPHMINGFVMMLKNTVFVILGDALLSLPNSEFVLTSWALPISRKTNQIELIKAS